MRYTKYSYYEYMRSLSSLQSNYDNLLIHQTKLRTNFCLFKKQFALENYILMVRRAITANFSRFRLSAHSLMIEKGRHFRNKIPIENRLCTLRNLNEPKMKLILCLDSLTTRILGGRCLFCFVLFCFVLLFCFCFF